MRPWSITYAIELPAPESIAMLIAPDEDSYLYQLLGIDGMPLGNPAEIGIYRQTLQRATSDLLHQQMQAVLPLAPELELPHGTATVTFGLIVNDQETPEFATFPLDEPLPPEVQKLQDEMIRAGQTLLQHRYRTLKAEASWKTPAFSVNDELELELHLHNSGAIPCKIPNPATAENEDEVGVMVAIERDVPTDQLQDGESVAIPLLPDEIWQIAAPDALPGDPPEPIVTLDTGQELVLGIRICRHLYLTPARYRAFVVYNAANDAIPEDDAIPGRVAASAGSMNIINPKP